MIRLWFDGLFKGLPGYEDSNLKAGFMCYGWLVAREDTFIARGHGAFARSRDATSNVAEYLGLIEGLEALLDLADADEAVQVFGDAKSIIDQMRGIAAVNSPMVKPLYRRASRLARRFHNLSWTWMPRRYNSDADRLTRRAMKQIFWNQKELERAVQALDPSIDHGRPASAFLPVLDLRVYQPASLT